MDILGHVLSEFDVVILAGGQGSRVAEILGNTPKIFKKEYLKYISVEYPLSTIRSKKFTAFTVQATIVRPNKMTKKFLRIYGLQEKHLGRTGD